MGQIAIVSFQNSHPKVIECFNVESRVLCMVYAPAEERPREPSTPEPEATAGRVLGVPAVCLGTEEGRWVHHRINGPAAVLVGGGGSPAGGASLTTESGFT